MSRPASRVTAVIPRPPRLFDWAAFVRWTPPPASISLNNRQTLNHICRDPFPRPGADEQLELISMVLVPQVKIAVPEVPPDYVTRANLCADLDAQAAADVALVCAPPGYGKTLLLADWARTSTAIDTAWVGIDRDDNDPRRLWSAVMAAVACCPSVPGASRLQPPGCGVPRPRRSSSRSSPPPWPVCHSPSG
jgi:hypothetical protein